jgi:hypothetical protein
MTVPDVANAAMMIPLNLTGGSITALEVAAANLVACISPLKPICILLN